MTLKCWLLMHYFMTRFNSLWLALLGNILHHIFLLLLCLFHIIWIHILHHLSHKKGDSDHDNKWILHVDQRIEWGLQLEVLDARGWVKLKGINKSKVFFGLDIKKECFRVFARSKFFIVYLNYDRLKVII